MQQRAPLITAVVKSALLASPTFKTKNHGALHIHAVCMLAHGAMFCSGDLLP
jgi:hypothetical protein